MSALKNVAQGFRNIWGAAETEEDYETPDEFERESSHKPAESAYRHSSREGSDDRSDSRSDSRYDKFTSPPASSSYSDTNGGSSHARRLRSVAMPLRAARDKNIYTLKPKSLEESCMAADYLKTGCAVVVNLEEVEGGTAIRIIDFMSGVCYGLEHQGHAMKLGDKIFLFTPGDFEISSDEVDYAENRDLIFKDVTPQPALDAPTPMPVVNPERRSWER